MLNNYVLMLEAIGFSQFKCIINREFHVLKMTPKKYLGIMYILFDSEKIVNFIYLGTMYSISLL